MSQGDLLQLIRQDLSSVVDVLEERFLYLLKEEAKGGIPTDELATELPLLSRDLKRCFQKLVEIQERRDLNFKATRELQEIDQRCVWLFRRIVVYQASLKMLSLETKLRGLVSTEVFAMYQALLSLDEEERQSSASDDAQIRALILEEGDQTGILPPSTG